MDCHRFFSGGSEGLIEILGEDRLIEWGRKGFFLCENTKKIDPEYGMDHHQVTNFALGQSTHLHIMDTWGKTELRVVFFFTILLIITRCTLPRIHEHSQLRKVRLSQGTELD